MRRRRTSKMVKALIMARGYKAARARRQGFPKDVGE